MPYSRIVKLPDPFYMHCHNLETTGGQEVISSYLFPFFIVNHPHTDTSSAILQQVSRHSFILKHINGLVV